MSSYECMLAFSALEEAFVESGWTKEQLGWFLLGAAISLLKRSGITLERLNYVIKEAYGEFESNPSTVN